MKTLNITVFVLIFVLSLAGCSSSKNKAAKKSISPEVKAQLEKLEGIFQVAESKDVQILAPNWYKKAANGKKLSMKLIQQKEQDDIILTSILETENQIKKAIEIHTQAATILANTVDARKDALKAGADPKTDDFQKYTDELKYLALLIEGDRTLDAQKNMPSVTAAFRKIELTMIKKKNLDHIRKMIEQNIKLGAGDIAPKTHSSAMAALKNVEDYIEGERYNESEITKRVNEVFFIAQRAVNITINCKQLKNETPEDSVLRFERILTEISSKLEIADIRNKNFSKQKDEINSYIASLFRAGVNEAREKHKLADKVQGLQTEVRSLSDKEQIRQLLDSIHNDFSISEAEVYLQNDRVILRLFGISFPSGVWGILPEHEGLLTRVGSVVKKLGKSIIIVEGHTDAIGEEQKNQILSEKRANSIRDYLIKSGISTNERSSFIGYGHGRPIATNRSEGGRKKNRRIDLVINPLEL